MKLNIVCSLNFLSIWGGGALFLSILGLPPWNFLPDDQSLQLLRTPYVLWKHLSLPTSLADIPVSTI